MLEIALLATTVVAKFLVPFLQPGIDKVTGAIAEKFGKPAADQVTDIEKQLLNKVTEVFTEDEEKSALSVLKNKPASPHAQGMVEEYLRERLKADPDLAQELDRLVNTKGPTGQTGAQIMGDSAIATIIDNRNAHISGSVQIGTVIGGGSDLNAILNNIPRVPNAPSGGGTQPPPEKDA